MCNRITINSMKKMDDTSPVGRLLIAANAKYPHIKIMADLARFLNLSTNTLGNWAKRGLPSGKTHDLAQMFDCNVEWLKTGEGEMTSEINDLRRSIEIEELNIKQRKLDDEDFARVRRFCEDLIRSKRK